MTDTRKSEEQDQQIICIEATLKEIWEYKCKYVHPKLNVKGPPERYLNDCDAAIITLALMERVYPETREWEIGEQYDIALEANEDSKEYIQSLLDEGRKRNAHVTIGSESAIVINRLSHLYHRAREKYAKQYSRKVKSTVKEEGVITVTQTATDFQEQGKDPQDRYRDYAEEALALDLCDLAAKLVNTYKALMAWLYFHGKGKTQTGDSPSDTNASIAEFVKQHANQEIFKHSKLTIQKVSHMINVIKTLIAEHSPQTYSCEQVASRIYMRDRIKFHLTQEPDGLSRRQLASILNTDKAEARLVAEQLIAYGEAEEKRAIKTCEDGETKPVGEIYYVLSEAC